MNQSESMHERHGFVPKESFKKATQISLVCYNSEWDLLGGRSVLSCLALNKMLSWKLPRLFRVDQVPQVFHEQGILFGYRHPQSSATACILSLFQMTNETLNIWTHLLPFWFFVWRFGTALYMTDIQNDSYSWPMLVYMCTSCVYPLASSCAHTFSSMSKNARHICYFLDYGAVNLFSLGSAIAYSAYTFPDALICSTYHECYVALAVLNTILSTGLSCYSRIEFVYQKGSPQLALHLPGSLRKGGNLGIPPVVERDWVPILDEAVCCEHGEILPFPPVQEEAVVLKRPWKNACSLLMTPELVCEFLKTFRFLPDFRFLELQKPRLCKLLRVLAFAYPYTWDSLPILYRLFLFPGESSRNEAILYHQKHMVMTLLASFLYSAHLPERLAPGRFDYIGHSHQLFHVCVILATHLQMEAILLDKTLRKEWLLATSRPFSLPQIAAALLLCIIFSLSNIIYFSAALYRIPEPELHEKET